MQLRTNEQLKTAILKPCEELTIDQLRNLVNSIPEYLKLLNSMVQGQDMNY